MDYIFRICMQQIAILIEMNWFKKYIKNYFSNNFRIIFVFYLYQGWSSSADPRRRAMDIKHLEAEDMKKEMDEIQVRPLKFREIATYISNFLRTS